MKYLSIGDLSRAMHGQEYKRIPVGMSTQGGLANCRSLAVVATAMIPSYNALSLPALDSSFLSPPLPLVFAKPLAKKTCHEMDVRIAVFKPAIW